MMQRLEKQEGFPSVYVKTFKSSFLIGWLKDQLGVTKIDNIVNSKHRAHVTLERVEEDVLGFHRIRAGPITDEEYRSVRDQVHLEWSRLPVLLPIRFETIRDRKDAPWSHSCGLPYRNQGLKTKKEAFPYACKNVRSMLGVKEMPEFADCMANARSHLSDPEQHKVRAVWGYPMDMFLLEAKFVYPMLDMLISNETNIAFGFDMAQGGMVKVDREAKKHRFFVCLDWSSFDKTVPAFIIEDAFEIMARRFRMTRTDKKIWSWCKEYYLRTPIRLSNGSRYKKSGGIPSGTAFTSTINSICNELVIRYLFWKIYKIVPVFMKFLGDDSLLMFDEEFDFDINYFRETASRLLLMDVNMVKSISTTDRNEIKFLGFQNTNGCPTRKLEDWLISWTMPERSDTCVADTLTRTVGLIYANAGANTDFHQLASHFFMEMKFKYAGELKEAPKFTPEMTRMLQAVGAVIPTHWNVPTQNDIAVRLFSEPTVASRAFAFSGDDDETED